MRLADVGAYPFCVTLFAAIPLLLGVGTCPNNQSQLL